MCSDNNEAEVDEVQSDMQPVVQETLNLARYVTPCEM